jgi:hypothetical protein
MPWASAGASVASSVLGGAFGGGGDKAAARLAKHTAQANTMRLNAQQAANTENFQPYINSGLNNNDYLNYLMGTSKAYRASTPRPTMGDITKQYANEIRAAGLAGGKSYGVRDQARSDIYAQNLYKKKLAEWEQSAESGGQPTDGEFGSLMKNFGYSDLENDPVYNTGLQFGLDTGTNAIEARARASGSSDSGSVLKELAKYANDYGSLKAGESYNRFNANKDQKYNYLSGGINNGLNAASGLAGVNGNLSNQIANTNTDAANTSGALSMNAATNQGNAVQSLLGNLLYNYKNSRNSGIPTSSNNSSYDPWGGTKGYA